MNWDAVGAVSEFVGAVAVVASLLYLALQVRQNTKAIRSATFQSIIGLATGFAESISRDSDLARVFRSGMADLQSLNDVDQVRFHFQMIALLRRYENMYYQSQMGLLHEDQWEGLRASLFHMMVGPGSREWWSANDTLFNAAFRRFVADRLRAHPAVQADDGETAVEPPLPSRIVQ